jgi:hypothetical protein
VSILVVRRVREVGGSTNPWEGVAVAAGSEKRTNSVEVFVEKGHEYAAIYYTSKPTSYKWWDSVFTSKASIRASSVDSAPIVANLAPSAWLDAARRGGGAGRCHCIADRAALQLVGSGGTTFVLAANGGAKTLELELALAGTGYKWAGSGGGKGGGEKEGRVQVEVKGVVLAPGDERVLGSIVGTRSAVSVSYQYVCVRGEGGGGGGGLSRSGEELCGKFKADAGYFGVGQGDFLCTNTDGVGAF